MVPAIICCQSWYPVSMGGSPGKALQAVCIIQIHPHISLAAGHVGLLRLASPLHAAEQCEGQNLTGNDSLLIKVIGTHTPENMEKVIKHIQQHFRA